MKESITEFKRGGKGKNADFYMAEKGFVIGKGVKWGKKG